MSSHDSFAEATAAYALDALDAPDAERFEVHLATCTSCQQELARYRQLAAGLGSEIDVVSEQPPPSLRARVLARATAQAQSPRQAHVSPDTSQVSRPPVRSPSAPIGSERVRRPSFRWQSMALAASLTLSVGVASYAWMLRGATMSLREELADALNRITSLRAELVRSRRDVDRLMNTNNVVNAPALVTVNLHGQAGAPAAVGRALVSRSRGLILRAGGLPPLRPGRVYQVWVIPPAARRAPATPLGAGILTAEATGAFVLDGGPLPVAVPAVQIVAVTDEPGPTGSQAPSSPILLVGRTDG